MICTFELWQKVYKPGTNIIELYLTFIQSIDLVILKTISYLTEMKLSLIVIVFLLVSTQLDLGIDGMSVPGQENVGGPGQQNETKTGPILKRLQRGADDWSWSDVFTTVLTALFGYFTG